MSMGSPNIPKPPEEPDPIPTPELIEGMAGQAGKGVRASERKRKGRSSTILAGKLMSQQGRKLLG